MWLLTHLVFRRAAPTDLRVMSTFAHRPQLAQAEHTSRILQKHLTISKEIKLKASSPSWAGVYHSLYPDAEKGPSPLRGNEISSEQSCSVQSRLTWVKMGSFVSVRCQNNTSLLGSGVVLCFAQVFYSPCRWQLAWQLEPALPTVWPSATYLMITISVTTRVWTYTLSHTHTSLITPDQPTLPGLPQNLLAGWLRTRHPSEPPEVGTPALSCSLLALGEKLQEFLTVTLTRRPHLKSWSCLPSAHKGFQWKIRTEGA